MSSFVINKTGTDQVTLEMTTTGSYEASTTLRHELLDAKRSYVFCVDHLNVPLTGVTLTPFRGEVFRVFRRNVGTNIYGGAGHVFDNIATAEPFVFSIDQPYYDVGTVVEHMNSVSRKLEKYYTENGLVNFTSYGQETANAVAPITAQPARTANEIKELGYYPLLKFRMNSGGRLVIEGTSNFWNNFMLGFSRTGAELLGLSSHLLTHELVAGTTLHILSLTYYGITGIFQKDQLLAPGNIITPGVVARTVQLTNDQSLYTSLDGRVKIEVETHLPMQHNLLVRDDVEAVDNAVAEVFFEHALESSFQFDAYGDLTEKRLQTRLYSGQFPLIKKSDASKQWHKLTTSYEQRFFRFHVYMTWRQYNSVTDKWSFKKAPLPVGKQEYWQLGIRFLSEV